MIDGKYMQAAAKCLRLNIPFAIFAAPDKPCSFVARAYDSDLGDDNRPPQDRPSFLIKTFDNTYTEDLIYIPADLTPDDIIALPDTLEPLEPAEVFVSGYSTTYNQYIAAARVMLDYIKSGRVCKCVLSRRIAIDSAKNPLDAAQAYFAAFPGTYRALYWTRDTGLWMTATPELLASLRGHRIRTMALAGSRPIELHDQPWDDKNMTEHNVVLDYIRDTVANATLNGQVVTRKLQCGATESIPYGNIEHLRTMFDIEMSANAQGWRICDLLAPTPAVSGFPVKDAIAVIGDVESHSRLCYSGWIGLYDPQTQSGDFYVNLRCALMEPDGDGKSMRVNIYAGGGLMPDSNPVAEWHETELKAAPLLNALT